MSLAVLFHFLLLNMIRTLIYPSSRACDYSVELPHWSCCSWLDVCWRFGVAGLEWYPSQKITKGGEPGGPVVGRLLCTVFLQVWLIACFFIHHWVAVHGSSVCDLAIASGVWRQKSVWEFFGDNRGVLVICVKYYDLEYNILLNNSCVIDFTLTCWFILHNGDGTIQSYILMLPAHIRISDYVA